MNIEKNYNDEIYKSTRALKCFFKRLEIGRDC